jgi:hypothetical protein
MGAAAVDDVVHDDAVAPAHVADHVHHLGHARLGPPLVDDGEVGVQPLRDGRGAHHAADVGADHDQLAPA